MNAEPQTTNRERVVRTLNGWLMLPIVLLLFFGGFALFIYSVVAGVRLQDHPIWPLFAFGLLLEPVSIILFRGFFTLQPNEARLLLLFGAYKGTVREPGFHWGNPFYSNGQSQFGAFARSIEMRSNLGAGKPSGSVGEHKRLSRFKLSLRSRNFNSERLKVNDKRGNPVEIAAVVVWRVQ